MNQIILSTLLLLVGLVIGFGLTMLINTLRKNNATKKIEEMLEDEDFCNFSIEELEEILEFALSDNQ